MSKDHGRGTKISVRPNPAQRLYFFFYMISDLFLFFRRTGNEQSQVASRKEETTPLAGAKYRSRQSRNVGGGSEKRAFR